MEKKDIEYSYNDLDAYIKSLEKYNISAKTIEEIRNSPLPTTKWMPDEWKYSSTKPGGTVEISKLLYAKSEALYKEIGDLLADEMYEEFYKLFIETATIAFSNLVQSNAFKLCPNETTYFLYMTDDDRVSGIVNESSKQLNTHAVHEEFMKYSGYN